MSLDTNNILTATDLLINQRLNELKRDTTIEATIIDNNNSSIGEYAVRYQNSVLKVYTDNLSITYKVDEVVYISVQDGDLSNKLFITGRKNTNTQQYVDIIDVSQTVDLVGQPISDIYPIAKIKQTGIKGYNSTRIYNHENRNPVYLWGQGEDGEIKRHNEMFQAYKSAAKYLYITADFLTKFPENLTIHYGNFGLIFEFLSMDNVSYEYVLDRGSMLGNVFAQGETNTQTLILDLEGVSLKELISIRLFSEGFSHTGADGKNIEDAALVNNDLYENEIFVSNIFMSFATDVESINGYSTNILTPDGYYIRDTNGGYVRLVPQFKYNGREIDSNNYTVEWFEFDNSITIGDESYRSSAGRNWKYLSNERELVISKSNYFISQVYKCVFYYQTSIVSSAEKTVYIARDAVNNFFINYSKDSEGFVTLNIVSSVANYSPSNYTFCWSYTDSTGSVFSVDDTSDRIGFNIEVVDKVRRYACHIVAKATNTVAASVFYTVTRASILANFTVDFQTENQGVFLYNENGYLEAEDAYTITSSDTGLTLSNKGRELKFTITWNNTELDYTYMWFPPGITEDNFLDYVDENGSTLTGDYSPENSMLIIPAGTPLQNSYIAGEKDEPTALNYTIKSSYNKNYGDNTITLCVIVDGERYYFYFNFNFSKQGDLGTNGTDYQFVLVPCDTGYFRNAVSRNFVYSTLNNDFWESDNLSFYVKILNNGVDVTDQYDINCSIPKVYQDHTILMDGEKIANIAINAPYSAGYQDYQNTVQYYSFQQWWDICYSIADEYNTYALDHSTLSDAEWSDLVARAKWVFGTLPESGKASLTASSNGHYMDLKRIYNNLVSLYSFKYTYNENINRLRFYVAPSFNQGRYYGVADSNEDPLSESNIAVVSKTNADLEIRGAELNADLFLSYYSNIVEITASLKDGIQAADLSYNLYYLLPLGMSVNTNYYIDSVPTVVYDAEGTNPQYSRADLKVIAFETEDKVNFDRFYLASSSSSSHDASLIKKIDNITGLITPELFFDIQYARDGIISYGNSSHSVGVIAPIICHANAYSISGINDWDGMSLSIKEEQGTIYAAQVGAGIKDEYGRFTGTVIGLFDEDTQYNNINDSTVGLWGFQDGVASFGFKADGTAFIGRSDFGGQIQFDGNGGIIQSSNFSEFGTGEAVVYWGLSQNAAAPGFRSLNDYANQRTFLDGKTTTFNQNQEYVLNLYYSYEIDAQTTTSYYSYNEWPVDTSDEGDNTKFSYSPDDGRFLELHDGVEQSYVQRNAPPIIYETTAENGLISRTASCKYYSDAIASGHGIRFFLGRLPVLKSYNSVVDSIEEQMLVYDCDENHKRLTDEDGNYITKTVDVVKTTRSIDLRATLNSVYLEVFEQLNQSLRGGILFDRDGVLSLNNGEINAGSSWNFNLTSISSTSGGMKIDLTSGKMYAANFALSSANIEIDSDPYAKYALKIGSNFFITPQGTGEISGWIFNAESITSADESVILNSAGSVTIKSGKIGGWDITSDGFSASSGKVYLYTNGNMQFGSGNYVMNISQNGMTIGSGWSSLDISSGHILIGRSMAIYESSLVIGSSYWGGGLTLNEDGISIGGSSGLKIDSYGISIGNNMSITKDTISIGFSDNYKLILKSNELSMGSTFSITSSGVEINPTSNLSFTFGKDGLTLKEAKGSDYKDKIMLYWRSVDGNIAPYLQLGAGAGNSASIMEVAKYIDHLWLGSQDHTSTGIKIYADGKITVLGTSMTGTIYAVLAD